MIDIMSETAFDVIPYSDIKGNWKKIGSGSFGHVYKGSYLGIDVAIKEVLPSTDYDVEKYFEREYRLMKEARHPNVVLYLGLSRAPDGRIFIISEFVEGGNLRMYIYDKSKPFPWSLRISFATDICRALAYLHARKCIHRDLKGENLLLTSNLRIKITDFGFARIAARNDMESRRLTFCGTDAYMSPEIQTGTPFDLPTDIYSLGIIFAEIAARHLADDTHFARTGPTFSIDPDEVRRRASPGCPEAFVDLALSCLKDNPAGRPLITDIIGCLQVIEADVIARPENKDTHIGSIRFLSKSRKPGQAPRIPSFKFMPEETNHETPTNDNDNEGNEHDTEEDELAEAVLGLAEVRLNDVWESESDIHPEVTYSSLPSDYSAAVIQAATTASPSSVSSAPTIRPQDSQEPLLNTTNSVQSAGSYYTALGSQISVATIRSDATDFSHNSSSSAPLPRLHRFTLIKPGARRLPTTSSASGTKFEAQKNFGVPWSPFQLLFSSGLLVARCGVCGQRLGWKPSLECDDCGLRSHLKCSDMAPCDCGNSKRVGRANG